MTTTHHPIEPEELMAYLDGELSPERAAAAASHIEDCAGCQKLAADLREVSADVKTWQVESIPTHDSAVLAALDEWEKRPTPKTNLVGKWFPLWKGIALRPRVLVPVTAGFLVMAALIGVQFIGRNAYMVSPVNDESRAVEPSASPAGGHLNLPIKRIEPSDRDKLSAPAASAAIGGGQYRARLGDSLQSSSSLDGQPVTDQHAQIRGFNSLQQFAKLNQPPEVHFKEEREKAGTATTPTAPMIIRTADLAILAKDFDASRLRVEEIVAKHRGYIGELKAGANEGSGRSLQATLRVPASQLDAALAEMKSLGRVLSESQNGQEVTAQYVDLEARLANSRNTEQRLIDLLRERTGKLSDVLAVENELARVRGEIEQMEAERKSMLTQVDFATLNATITEDYKAQLQVVPPSTTTRLANAAVDGYRSMVDGVLNLTLFGLSVAPSFVLWAAILFFPARLGWKKLRALKAS
jgi:hypothetical protein